MPDDRIVGKQLLYTSETLAHLWKYRLLAGTALALSVGTHAVSPHALHMENHSLDAQNKVFGQL